MCGVFGVHFGTGKCAVKPEQQAILLAALADLNENRGRQSWGVYAPRLAAHERDTGPITEGFKPWAFARTPILVGHTRFATHGKITKENAHPFRVDNLVGLHNGVVSNHSELLKKYGRDFEVDSLHILKHIAEGRPLDDIEAYGSVQWIVDDEDYVHLTHFNGGELCVVRIPGKGLVWSSSDKHAVEAVKRAGLDDDMRVYKLKEGEVYITSPQKLYLEGEVKVGKYSSAKRWQDYGSGCGTDTWTSRQGSTFVRDPSTNTWIEKEKEDKKPPDPPKGNGDLFSGREAVYLIKLNWPTSEDRREAAVKYCQFNTGIEGRELTVAQVLRMALNDKRYMEEVEGIKHSDLLSLLEM